MKHKHLSGMIVLALAMAGCGEKKAGVEDAAQVQDAKAVAGSEQKVADLEKQLAAAKQDLAAKRVAAQAPVPKEYVVAAGTAIPVRTTTALSTRTTASGAPFVGSLTKALMVDGVELAPAGAEVSGIVVSSDPGGRVKGKASITVTLKSIQGTHGPIAIQTNNRGAVAKSTVKRDVIRGGIMSGAGAAIGAIAGGGKGAAIGAGAGAGAGVGTAMATRGEAAEIAPETVLTFTTKAPAAVTVRQ